MSGFDVAVPGKLIQTVILIYKRTIFYYLTSSVIIICEFGLKHF